jgi:hypothetical protein
MRAIVAVAATFMVAIAGQAHERDAQPRDQPREDAIGRSLEDIRHVNPADLSGNPDSARYRTAQALIRQQQCAASIANPLLVVSPPMRITRAGTFDISLQVAPLADLAAHSTRDAAVVAARARQLIAAYDPAGCGRQAAVLMPPSY